jgi:hypothetical protein
MAGSDQKSGKELGSDIEKGKSLALLTKLLSPECDYIYRITGVLPTLYTSGCTGAQAH